MSLIHGGDVAARQLVAEGVEIAFTLTGGHISPVYDGAWKESLRLIDLRHEQAVVHAADAYARLTRRPAVALVTAGPGVTCSLTGIANAFYANSPVVVLAGRNPLATDGMGSLQDAPHIEMVRPVTKRAETAFDPWRLPSVIREAFAAATSQRCGPTFVEIPMDVLLARCEKGEIETVRGCGSITRGAADPAVVKEVARQLARAERPVIFSGSGTYWSGAEDELRALVEVADVPLCVNGMSRGIVPSSHPNLVRRARRPTLAAADLVIVLGADFDFRVDFGRGIFADEARVVQVDPQADRLGRNFGPAFGVTSDIRNFIRQLMAEVETFGRTTPRDWTTATRERERHATRSTEAWRECDDLPIHPMRLLHEIARFADEDCVFVGDGGDIVAAAAAVVEPNRPGHWIDTGIFGCIGVGAPFALAARLARPRQQIIGIFGDGAFGFNAMEVDSAVRQGLPYVAVIGNDGAWGEIRTFHEDIFGAAHMEAQYLSQQTRYDKLAEALGGSGERVERPQEIAPALRRAAEAGVPAVLDVVLNQTWRRESSAISGKSVAAAFGGGDPRAFRPEVMK